MRFLMRFDPGSALKLARRVFLAWLVALAPAAHAATAYGEVEFVEGVTEVADAAGKLRTPRAGEKVYEGETMRTGKDGEMHVRTGDHGLVALRSNTRIKVEIYRADGDDEDRSVVALLSGTLRSITGWIGKYRPNSYSIKTSHATIGIRGTDHEPLYIAPGEKASIAPGTYDKVNAGSTYIETAAGRITIEKGRAGFAPHESKAPVLLDKIPEVYRPTKNEERIRKRKEELEREVEKARLERQKARAEAGEKAEKGDASKGDSSKAEATKEEARKKAAERRRHRTESTK